MDLLREIFPTISDELLQEQLDANNNLEDAVNALFAGNRASSVDMVQHCFDFDEPRTFPQNDEGNINKGKKKDINMDFPNDYCYLLDPCAPIPLNNDAKHQASILRKDTTETPILIEDSPQARPMAPVKSKTKSQSISLEDDVIAISDVDKATLDTSHNHNDGIAHDQKAQSENPVKFLADVFPDADEEWLGTILKESDGDVGKAVEVLTKEGGKYPKRSASKRKLDDDNRTASSSAMTKIKRKQNYWEVDASFEPSKSYQTSCKEQLRTDFPNELVRDIDAALKQHNHQYAPAYKYLTKNQQNGRRKPNLRDRKQKRKRIDEIFEEEFEWVLAHQAVSPNAFDFTGETEDESSYECGCCFTDNPMSHITQCAEAHLFCMECARKYVEGRIGDRLQEMKCMSADDGGCTALFPDSELKRFLSKTSYEAYERLVAEEALRTADIIGLVKCPFCDFAMVMDQSPDEVSLFSCQNQSGTSPCGVISCRKCQKPNHLPKSCQEAKADNVLDVKHTIEEKMTEALLRECPKCKRKSFKEEGCNKMTCVCGMTFCYVCGASPVNYNHFHQAFNSQCKGTCPLHDDSVKRNAENVKRAAEKALEAAKNDNPDVLADVKIDAPKVKEGIRAFPNVPNVAGVFQALPRGFQAMPGAVPNPNGLFPFGGLFGDQVANAFPGGLPAPFGPIFPPLAVPNGRVGGFPEFNPVFQQVRTLPIWFPPVFAQGSPVRPGEQLVDEWQRLQNIRFEHEHQQRLQEQRKYQQAIRRTDR